MLIIKTQVQQAIDYIQAHLDRDLSLTEIAQAINISKSSFSSSFKDATGISPYKYVVQERIKRAKLLLSKKGSSIFQIALLVGFYDSSHFIRTFKDFTGVTPEQFRKEQT